MTNALLPYKSKQQGFSLLETLVAFAILSLVLAVIFQIYSQGSLSTRLAHEYTEATIIAQSKLASAQTGDTSLVSGIEKDKYNWVLKQKPHNYADVETGHYKRSYVSYVIAVEVSWKSAGKHRKVQLETVRLGNRK